MSPRAAPSGRPFAYPEASLRSVTLVTGPPCSGKSTYVREHAQAGDLIVCLDTLAREAGSQHEHDHQAQHYDAARARYQALVDQLGHDDHARAWIIRCAPLPAERTELAHRARAQQTLVLLPALAEALRRARLERNPKIKGAIHHWYRRYQPAAGDTLLAQ